MNTKLAIGVIVGLGIIIIVLSATLVMVIQNKKQETSRVPSESQPATTISK